VYCENNKGHYKLVTLMLRQHVVNEFKTNKVFLKPPDTAIRFMSQDRTYLQCEYTK